MCWIVMVYCGACLPHLGGCCLQITLKATEDGVNSVVLDTRDLRIQGIFAEDGSHLQHHMGEHSDVSNECIIWRCTRRCDGWQNRCIIHNAGTRRCIDDRPATAAREGCSTADQHQVSTHMH
jgi:hypothetical protein